MNRIPHADDYRRDEEISVVVQQLTAVGRAADPNFYGVARTVAGDGVVVYTTGDTANDEARLRQLYSVDAVRGSCPVTFKKSFISLAQGEALINALEAARPIVAAEHGLILTTYGPEGPVDAEKPILVRYSRKGAAPTSESLLRLSRLLPPGSMDLIVFETGDVIALTGPH